jgi:hypothetical protein
MHEAVESIRDLLARVGRWIQRHPPVRLTRGMVTGFVRTDGMMYAARSRTSPCSRSSSWRCWGSFCSGWCSGRRRRGGGHHPARRVHAALSPRRDRHHRCRPRDPRGLGLLAVPLLLFGGIGLFFAVQRGVSRAFSTTPRASILREQLVNLGLMALVGALLVASLIIGFVVWLIEAGSSVSTCRAAGCSSRRSASSCRSSSRSSRCC